MEQIGLYTQLTSFTTEHAGTAEWCKVERAGKEFFVKKFHSPVYPSKNIGLPEKMYAAGVEEFHKTIKKKEELYQRLRECDQSEVLVVPVEVINYQFHICTIAEYVTGNVKSEQIHLLSEWQRLVLMRTLTLALMSIHKAGIVHSDMKPDNVLVTQDEKGNCRLRLIDFDGSFFESDPPLDSEDVIGDPAFFSPEAYQQSIDEDIRLDHRIDIFALGLIFHYFWTGTYPGRPENQTIGESLIRDETITIDKSIPLVLKQLILKMIAKEPDDRISLKSVYDVLGVQIGLYTPNIIKISASELIDTKINPQPQMKEEQKTAEVTIDFRDENGELIKSKTLKIPYGACETVMAERIDGYNATGSRKKEVSVSASGYVMTPVTFTYKKTQNKGKAKIIRKLLIILGVLFVLYIVAMALLADYAEGSGDYESARQYLNAIPLYTEIFPDEYREIKYKSAVNDYRGGRYYQALDKFYNIEKTYGKTELYMEFCRVHINNPEDYYSLIVNNLNFEDAKTILAGNDELFCRYMIGKWTYTSPSSSEEGIVTMGDDYIVSGMPELPGGGSYWVENGIFQYWYDGSDNPVDFYRITVQSEDLFVIYSYQSKTTYTFKRSATN